MTLEEKQKAYDALMINKHVRNGMKLMDVTSTRIFCQPNCPARRPKLENCEFFTSAEEAIATGFRACKPTENPWV